jgi:hypothetical protein
MYSRLYTRVLNCHAWAQNCTAFHSVFDDTGVVGISGVADGYVGRLGIARSGPLDCFKLGLTSRPRALQIANRTHGAPVPSPTPDATRLHY